jgi:hypothetical protein
MPADPPTAFAVRFDRLAALLDHRIITAVPGTREPFWRTFVNCAQTNPAALRFIMSLMAMYLHLGPFSRHVISVLDRRIDALDAQMPERPVAHDKTSVAAVM